MRNKARAFFNLTAQNSHEHWRSNWLRSARRVLPIATAATGRDILADVSAFLLKVEFSGGRHILVSVGIVGDKRKL